MVPNAFMVKSRTKGKSRTMDKSWTNHGQITDAFIAAAGVVLGVAALIIMLSVTNGFTGEVKNRLIGMNAHIAIKRNFGEAFSGYREIVARTGAFEGVVAAAPDPVR